MCCTPTAAAALVEGGITLVETGGTEGATPVEGVTLAECVTLVEDTTLAEDATVIGHAERAGFAAVLVEGGRGVVGVTFVEEAAVAVGSPLFWTSPDALGSCIEQYSFFQAEKVGLP